MLLLSQQVSWQAQICINHNCCGDYRLVITINIADNSMQCCQMRCFRIPLFIFHYPIYM